MISFEEGNAAITRSGNTYTIQFIDVSHMLHCGMRGQLADQITIVRGKKECDVRQTSKQKKTQGVNLESHGELPA